MRRLMRMIMEFALEENKANNDQVALLREVYPFLDRQLGNEEGPIPAKLTEALTVGDFPVYFNRTLSRAVLDRYNYRRGTWRDYTLPDTVPDYSQADRFRFSEFDAPEKRREKEETRAGYIYEETEVHVQVEDYSKQIDFSNRILVNDDLGAFNDLVRKLGDSGNRFEDFYVSALYDNALTQAAMIALGVNYGGTGRLTTNNLMIAINAFALRTDARGNPLLIVPKYLVIPPLLRLTANQILMSEKIAELATNGINPIRGALEVREDPYIMGFVSPNIPWYLFADPNDTAAVRVARMDGRPGVRLYTKAPDKVPMTAAGGLGQADWRTGSFLTGDIEIEVETTIGGRVGVAGTLVGVCDPQGLWYSSGTTP